ncbi:MAG: DUF421 domain-containing protein [Rickettsiales bacterium]|jgi:uncharacterized membrane protein YcaP (DUF421 family)|nr:DUF421 domain-containing protein [Rickettsiales bacterium]
MPEFLMYYGMRVLEFFCAFVVVMLFRRVFGLNYQMKQMTALDIIFNFILAAILTDFIIDDNVKISQFLVLMSVYIIMVGVINWFSRRTDFGRRLLMGSPKVIIQDGKLQEKTIQKINVSAHEIAAAIREEGIHSLSEIRSAQIETDGSLTIVKKGARDYSITIIDNGVVDSENLARIKKTNAWLRTELKKHKITDIDDVFAAQWDRNKLHIIKKS